MTIQSLAETLPRLTLPEILKTTLILSREQVREKAQAMADQWARAHGPHQNQAAPGFARLFQHMAGLAAEARKIVARRRVGRQHHDYLARAQRQQRLARAQDRQRALQTFEVEDAVHLWAGLCRG